MINARNYNLMRWAFLLGPQYLLLPEITNVRGKTASRRVVSVRVAAELDPYELTERFVEGEPLSGPRPVKKKEVSETFRTYLDQPAGAPPSEKDFRKNTADALFEAFKKLLDQTFTVKVPFPTGEVTAKLKFEYFTDPEMLRDILSKPHLFYWFIRKNVSPVQREQELSSAERKRLDQVMEEIASNFAEQMQNPESRLVQRMVNRISKAVRHTAQYLGPLSALEREDKGRVLDRVKPLAEDLVTETLENIGDKLKNKRELHSLKGFYDALKRSVNVIRHYTEVPTGMKKSKSFLPQIIRVALLQVSRSPAGLPMPEAEESESDWKAKVDDFLAAVREEVFERLLGGISAIRELDEKDIAKEDDWVRKFLDQLSGHIIEKSGLVPWKKGDPEGYEHIFNVLGYLFGEIKWNLREYREKFRGQDKKEKELDIPAEGGEGTLGQMLEAPDVAQSGVGSALDQLLAFFPVWFLGANDPILDTISGVEKETLGRFKKLVSNEDMPDPTDLIPTRQDIFERLRVLVRWGLLGGKKGTGLSYMDVFAPPSDSDETEKGNWEELKRSEQGNLIQLINPKSVARTKSQAMLTAALQGDLPRYFTRFVRYLMDNLNKYWDILEGGSGQALDEVEQLVEGLHEEQKKKKQPHGKLQEELQKVQKKMEASLRLAVHLPKLGYALASYLDNPHRWETGERFAGKSMFELWFRRQVRNLS